MFGKIFQLCVLVIVVSDSCRSLKILAIFPYNGKSHHILFSSLMEELAFREHDVTAIYYWPMKTINKLKQISLAAIDEGTDNINIEEYYRSLPYYFRDLYMAYTAAYIFENIARENCLKMIKTPEIQSLIKSDEKFDLILVEQFVTDCGLALAYRFKAPTVGITAHVLMPYTYGRIGVPNHQAYVPNMFTRTGSEMNLFERMKSLIINIFMNFFYDFKIQKPNQEVMSKLLPNTPPLETLAKNLSLVMVNQYFPLTDSRLVGPNVIEIGGLHIKDENIIDKEVKHFLNSAEYGVIYISFGSVASSLPRSKLQEIFNLINNSKQKFLWKLDTIEGFEIPGNVLIRKWMPQVPILCHPNVKAFITHSGMLSSAEAMHCGVPTLSVPLFGDQFANAASARDSGLGVTVDYEELDKTHLETALNTVLQEKYQTQANLLSTLWRDRPMSPMNTAIYWIEYVARHQGAPQLRPRTIDLPFYQYLMLDVLMVLGLILTVVILLLCKIFTVCLRRGYKSQKINKKIKTR